MLVAIDLTTRAAYLAPRLVTVRGAVNYAVASLTLWLTLRLLATLSQGRRAIAFALLVALPMAVEWAMFRSFGQFVETTDFVAAVAEPGVTVRAARSGADAAGAAFVFALALGAGWLLPRSVCPLRAWRAGLYAAIVATALGVGASYWRASPNLEHSQPAFASAAFGLLRRASARTRSARHVVVAPGAPAPLGVPGGEKLPNIVLVLGESLAASHLTLYGYDRPTSPKLAELRATGELVALRDVVVAGPHTRTSVPYIVTGLEGPDPRGRVFGAPNVLEYAKARGYHTAFVSAQEESWGGLDTILREGADTFRTGLQFAPEVDILKGCDDPVLLAQGALPALASLAEPFVLVVHMDGSHMPYGHHSPPAYKVFPEDDGVNGIAAYDNTVRVTDDFLARLFAAVRRRDREAWMFYTSDHGQALGEGGAFFHRGYQSNVVKDPLLVFPPDEASRAEWLALADAPIEACDLAPTLLHLMHTAPIADAPMDCLDLLGGAASAAALASRTRVVSAYTPAFLSEETMLLVRPDGHRALYELWRGTVTLDDGTPRPMSEQPFPPAVASRLGR
jgi:glucan phosphoethanolaminetransferase (alkaline phosphatase superfamily)